MNMHNNPIHGEHLEEAARCFQYPSTPDVAGAVMKRLESGSRPRVQVRSAWVVMGFLVLALTILFAVPGVRAEILRFFQVGVVRIFPATPTLTVEPSKLQLPTTATPMVVLSNTATHVPGVNVPVYEVTIAGLAGETSLAEAQATVPFLIRLPKYPASLGAPDRVFLQEDGGMVILVWIDPTDPESAGLSLHQIAPGNVIFSKYEPRVIQETQVNRNYAIWAQGPYLVRLTSGSYDFRRTVEGNTLIWEENGITYRLETDMTLEEAVKIAELLE